MNVTPHLYNTRLCPSASFAYSVPLIRVLYIAMPHPARCCPTMPLFRVTYTHLSLHASHGTWYIDQCQAFSLCQWWVLWLEVRGTGMIERHGWMVDESRYVYSMSTFETLWIQSPLGNRRMQATSLYRMRPGYSYNF